MALKVKASPEEIASWVTEEMVLEDLIHYGLIDQEDIDKLKSEAHK